MNRDALRNTLVLLALAVALVASVAYDSLYFQSREQWQVLLAGLIAASLAAVVLARRYPAEIVQPVVIAAWPLHLFTIGFFWACFAFHGGDQLHQVASYTLFAYALYLLVPLGLLLDRKLFAAFVQGLAILSAILAVPSLAGAAGQESFLGIPVRVKFGYAQLSGINASAGIFEHPEGHALQMAVGVFCCWYALRRTRRGLYAVCLLLTLTGLIISQGRAALLGVLVALAFCMLPELFRRSRPLFLGSLVVLLAFPLVVFPYLSQIPGLRGYLRVERGLSGRSAAWEVAVDLVEDKPWTGHGFMASTRMTEQYRKALRKAGFSGIGTTFHSTFISRAVDLGLPVTALYALLYLVPLVRICRPSSHTSEQTLIRCIALVTLTTALFRDYNIGGVRSTALIGALFLGLANLWAFSSQWQADRPEPAAAESQRPFSPALTQSASVSP